jgi:NAD(P)-dependent dehydrogenase (short-subunit alcohol dehydrogenase family)
VTKAVVLGASRGIGAALVSRLLERGQFDGVYAGCRNPAQSAALEDLGSQYPQQLICIAVDTSNESTIAAAAQRVDGEIGLMIYAAGVLHDDVVKPEKRLEQLDPSALQRSFAVNAIGPMLAAKHFVAKLTRQDRVVIANISARVGSIADNRLGGWYGYRTSKAAQNMFTKTLALELSRRLENAICVALHPGTVDTALSRPFQRRVPQHKLFTPSLAAQQLLSVIDGLQPSDSGGFFAWDGSRIPW